MAPVETKKGGLKAAGIVLAAVAFGWMAVELAFKPFLQSGRKAIDKANPDHDPDDEDDDDYQELEHEPDQSAQGGPSSLSDHS